MDRTGKILFTVVFGAVAFSGVALAGQDGRIPFSLNSPFHAAGELADSLLIHRWPGDPMPVMVPDMSRLAKMPMMKMDSLPLSPMPVYRPPSQVPQKLDKGAEGKF